MLAYQYILRITSGCGRRHCSEKPDILDCPLPLSFSQLPLLAKGGHFPVVPVLLAIWQKL
jgi:hypothetical protein